MSDCDLTLIVPVFNEGKNFPALWEMITLQIRSRTTVLVVYDFDEDDTVPVVRRIINDGETRLRLVKNDIRLGVVGAILAGLRQIQSGPVMVVMADLCDDLSQVDQMLALYRQGYDVVAGSRYMSGGKIIEGPFLKQGLSRLAGLTLCWLRGIPTHDATNAFKLYDREMLQSFTIESKAGFELNLELTVKAFLSGYHITEIPTTWRERSAGKSRFRLWAWLPKYLRWYFYAFQPRQAPRPLATPPRRAERDHPHIQSGRLPDASETKPEL
jgi:dolichol-phosphate mannosyltransferase